MTLNETVLPGAVAKKNGLYLETNADFDDCPCSIRSGKNLFCPAICPDIPYTAIGNSPKFHIPVFAVVDGFLGRQNQLELGFKLN